MTSAPRLLLLACLCCTLPALAQSSEDRVDPNGPYRSKMRVLEDVKAPTVDLDEAQLDGYGTALNRRAQGYAAARDGNDAAAIAALREALATGVLAPLAQDELRRDLIALWARAENDDALATAHRDWRGRGAQFDALSNVLAARAYTRVGQHADALTTLDLALANAQEAEPAWFDLKVYILVQLGRYAPAAALAARQLPLTSRDATAWRNLIEIQRAANDLRSATATAELAFERGVLNDADDVLAIVRLYLASGLPDHAVAVLRDAPADDARYLQLAVRAHVQAGDDAGALAPSRALVKLDKTPATRYALAQLEHKLQLYDDAIATLRSALRGDLGSQRGRALLLLGESYLALGRIGPARRAFEQATDVGGAYRQAQAYLERLSQTPESADTRPTAEDSDDHPPLPVRADAPPADRLPIARKRVPRQRFYYLSSNVDAATLPTQLVTLSRRVRLAVRRERLAAAGPLQWRVDASAAASQGEFELELGVPVRTRVAPRGRFRNRDLLPIDCAYVEYLGDPRGLGDAWVRFMERVKAAGLPLGRDARTVVLDARAPNGEMRFELQIELIPDEGG